METDYSKRTYFRWKIKWRPEHLGALGTMGEIAPISPFVLVCIVFLSGKSCLLISLNKKRKYE